MQDISTYLFTQGVLGVACFVLGLIVWKFYNKIERLEKEKFDLVDARRVDALDGRDKLSAVMDNSSQTIRVLTEKIEAAKKESR